MKRPLAFLFTLLLGAAASSAWALTPAQLNAQERAAYNQLTDSSAQQSYLVTREYLRQCDKVLAKSMSALNLPDLPDAFNGDYISPAEQGRIDRAANLHFAALVTAPIIA